FAAELEGVVLADDAEVIDQRHRVVGVGLAAAVLRAVAANEIAERGGAGRSALSADAGNSDGACVADVEGAGVDAGDERGRAVDTGLVEVGAELRLIDHGRAPDLGERPDG